MKKSHFTVDQLFAGLPASAENSKEEALQAKLIDAFESALIQGMSPMDALAVVLEWASSELHRIPHQPKHISR